MMTRWISERIIFLFLEWWMIFIKRQALSTTISGFLPFFIHRGDISDPTDRDEREDADEKDED